MRVLRAGDYRLMPWKNGGGVTTEIIVSPAGAGLDDFDWRISMAKVESGGPFSSFANIDRTLSVLEGEGIELAIAGQNKVRLDRTTPPLPFPADAPTEADLIGGPILDLNVMSRRGRRSHTVRRVNLSTPLTLASQADIVIVFDGDGVVDVQAPDPVRLGPHDAIVLEPGERPIRFEPVQSATLFIVEIHEITDDH